MQDDEVVGVPHHLRLAWEAFPVAPYLPRERGFNGGFESVQRDVGEQWADHSSYEVANKLLEFVRIIPRTYLRPGYGDGFGGAPLASDPLGTRRQRAARGEADERTSEPEDPRRDDLPAV